VYALAFADAIECATSNSNPSGQVLLGFTVLDQPCADDFHG
jgi:hypothetical protein